MEFFAIGFFTITKFSSGLSGQFNKPALEYNNADIPLCFFWGNNSFQLGDYKFS